MKGIHVEWDGQSILNEGEYAKSPSGIWYAATPGNHLANLSGHSVTEHEDGTITVSPSIRVSTTGNKELWHGYLEKGIWRSC
ncbi:MAG: hypothetical protein Q7R33_02885 [Nitrosarchaeum sp.]|nr:hypothetical protein [Nitrosarchaeum sp.]